MCLVGKWFIMSYDLWLLVLFLLKHQNPNLWNTKYKEKIRGNCWIQHTASHMMIDLQQVQNGISRINDFSNKFKSIIPEIKKILKQVSHISVHIAFVFFLNTQIISHRFEHINFIYIQCVQFYGSIWNASIKQMSQRLLKNKDGFNKECYSLLTVWDVCRWCCSSRKLTLW